MGEKKVLAFDRAYSPPAFGPPAQRPQALGVRAAGAADTGAEEALPGQRDLENLGEFFKVLTDPTRLKILYALDYGELCVFDLSVSTGASVSSVSHHLSALRHVRLVKARREGRVVYYSLDDDHVNTILKYAREHLEER